MIASRNLSLRTVARPFSSVFAKLKRGADFLISIPTTCMHRNRRQPSDFMQVCFDCERVRFNVGNGWSVWHRDGVR